MAKNNAPVTTTNNYDFDEDDFAVNEQIPWAQWITPKSDESKVFGLGIKEEQAEIIGFTPDDRWKKESITLGKGDNKKAEVLYYSQNPRLIVLNGSQNVQKGIVGNAQPLYMARWEDKKVVESFLYNKNLQGQPGIKPFSYIVLMAVDKDGNPLGQPFRLKISKASIRTLKDLYEKTFKPEWVKQYGLAYEKATGKKLPAGQQPTCKFLSRAIFEPILTIGEQTSPATNESSIACQALSMNPLTPQTFDNYCLPLDHPTTAIAQSYMASLLNYVKLDTRANPESTEDAIASAPVDIETGEIAVTPEVLAELTKGDIPF